MYSEEKPETHSFVAHIGRIADVVSDWGFSGVKFLATRRRQDARLASECAQNSHKVRGASQDNFENWVRDLLHDPVEHYAGGGEKLSYNRL